MNRAYLSAILSTITTAPGLWISIIGTLRAPTNRSFAVCTSCGAYCSAASSADVTPRNVAHACTRRSCGESGPGEGAKLERRRKVTKVISALTRRWPSEGTEGKNVRCVHVEKHNPAQDDRQSPRVTLDARLGAWWAGVMRVCTCVYIERDCGILQMWWKVDHVQD